MSDTSNLLSESQLTDLRLAASKLSGHKRRSFQAEMSLKYCHGNPRLTETVFGWSRDAVELGLAEKSSGIICIGSQSMLSGRKSWEENCPEASAALRKIAEAHSQQDPTFDSLIAYTRLTSAAAIKLLQLEGFKPEEIPKPSSMALVLNRMGYRLRRVVKAKPKKNFQKQMIFLAILIATIRN
jgi:Rhodopirellula transposase DDE domain